MHHNNQHGAMTVIVAIILVIAAIGGGIAYYVSQSKVSVVNDAMEKEDVMIKTTPTAATPVGGEVMEKEAGDIMQKKETTTYGGAVLAGTTSPFVDFTEADYEIAQKSGKLVVLYFYANWCPICREEFPKMQAAFNQLSNPNVIAFRVNYNDDQTDAAEKALAREHGVAYQHTKVFVKNGQQILKSPETWETGRYITEITNAAR
jgi:thiol-disulfide isomerase/thioredoxin